MQTLAAVSRPTTKVSSSIVKIVPLSFPEIAANRGFMFLKSFGQAVRESLPDRLSDRIERLSVRIGNGCSKSAGGPKSQGISVTKKWHDSR